MRITCKHCGDTMVITHSESITPGVKEVTGNCINPHCQCRSLFKVAWEHDKLPPMNKPTQPAQLEQLVLDLFQGLPQASRQNIAQRIS